MITGMRCVGTAFACRQSVMLAAFFRLAYLTGIVLLLTACAPIIAIVGYGQPAVQAAAQVDRIKLIADGISYVGSGKTISDHALSLVKGEDCKIVNVISRDPVCAPKAANTLTAQ
jgi:hypothetical protein